MRSCRKYQLPTWDEMALAATRRFNLFKMRTNFRVEPYSGIWLNKEVCDRGLSLINKRKRYEKFRLGCMSIYVALIPDHAYVPFDYYSQQTVWER